MLTAPAFRAILTEFSDLDAYPDAAITFWLTDAYNMLNPYAWGNQLDKGAMLYTAHQIVLGKRNAQAAGRAGTPGAVSGPISSKSVGPASVSYDTSSVTNEGAGFYNSTSYGVQFWNLLQMAGAGGQQVSGYISQAPDFTQNGLFPNA